MITFFLFIFSGLALVTLALTKRMEEKRKTGVFLFKLISKGDENIRNLHHKSLHFYSVSKHKAEFFFKKQLPIHSRKALNKFVTKLSEQAGKYMGDIRDSRLLKKSDGISEFFKNMSSVEKGMGEINEGFMSEEIVPVIIPKKKIIRRKKEKVLEIK